jgi:hypothetical protein
MCKSCAAIFPATAHTTIATNRQIPEEVESFTTDINEVAKTARMSAGIFGHVLNSNTGKGVTLGSNSTQC